MKKSTSTVFAAALIFLTWGCGGRSFTGTSGGDAGPHSNTDALVADGATGECTTAEDCLLAVKHDTCCPCPQPSSQADLAADPCLLPLEVSQIPEECQVDCPEIPCPACPSPGRSVECRQGECAWKEGICEEDEECLAAIRTDNCCEAAFPATLSDIEEDECLVVWPIAWETVSSSCLDRWPEECAYIDCMPAPPPSRAVECGPDGCEFVGECEENEECGLVVDTRKCCFCPEVWPLSMVSHVPCLVRSGDPIPAGCRPPECENILCEECDPPPSPNCIDSQCLGLVAF